MERLVKPKRKIQYNLRMDHEDHIWVKKIAEEYERPINYVIKQAIKSLRKQIESAKA